MIVCSFTVFFCILSLTEGKDQSSQGQPEINAVTFFLLAFGFFNTCAFVCVYIYYFDMLFPHFSIYMSIADVIFIY